MSIAIIDYGSGNLRSVQKAFQKLGFSAQITKDKVTIRGSQGVVLPGVGSFDAALNELRQLGLEAAAGFAYGLPPRAVLAKGDAIAERARRRRIRADTYERDEALGHRPRLVHGLEPWFVDIHP